MPANKIACPSCSGPLVTISGGGASPAGYKYLYRHCKNEDCELFEIKIRVRRYNDGNEELVSIQSPGEEIGDIDQARYRLYQHAITDFRWFGSITEETKELARLIAESK